MHSTLRVCSVVLVVLASRQLRADRIPGTRMNVDWPALISRHDITLTKPGTDSYTGLILGNGDIAVSLFGPPELLTLHVGKNDLWDYRDAMDAKRPVSHKDFLAKYTDAAKPPVTNYLFDPKVDAHNVDIRATYEDAAPTSKPAGQIRFRTHGAPQAPFAATLNLWNAEASTARLRTFVSYPRNLIVVTYDPHDLGPFEIELARHKDVTGLIPNGPEFGAAGRDMWVRYRFPSDPATYPNGFEYVMYARVIADADSKVDLRVEKEFAKINQSLWRVGPSATLLTETVESAGVARVDSKRPVTLLVAVMTTRDDPKPMERARAEIDASEKLGLDGLTREHRSVWHDFWKRSFVLLDGHEGLNRDWYFDQYLLGCAFRAGRVMPGLFGAWAWEDYPWFGNDYHWDYNTQQSIWGAFSSNHLEQVEPYVDAALQQLPAAVADAKETYGIDGAKFFLTSYPHNYRHNPFPLLHYDKMMSLNGWVAHPLWWKYLYSQDREYLRTRAYPLMREAAKFYLGYLTQAADGKYDIFPTAAWDVDFTPHLKFNRNFPMDLSFVKYLFHACATASEILNVDSDLRKQWSDVAAQLRDYPTDGKVFTAYEGSTASYHFPLASMMIFPGDDVGLHSPAPIREMAERTLAPMTYSGDEQLLKAVQRVRMGIDDVDTFEKQLAATTKPNGTISYGQFFFWIHGCGNTLWANESLVQSYTGAIRVAPVKRKFGARFVQLRTVGAFLVSGEIRPAGEIAYLAIESETGSNCRLIRPWAGELRIRELSSLKPVEFETSGDEIRFKTQKGGQYVVDRPTDSWENQPISSVP